MTQAQTARLHKIFETTSMRQQMNSTFTQNLQTLNRTINIFAIQVDPNNPQDPQNKCKNFKRQVKLEEPIFSLTFPDDEVTVTD
jgi:hypothetical protein